MNDNTEAAKPVYRAGYKGQKRYFATIEDAARYTLANGGSIDRLAGSVYRTISGKEQDAAEQSVSR